MRDRCSDGVCTIHSRNTEEGVFKLPLEVKDGFKIWPEVVVILTHHNRADQGDLSDPN